MAEVWRGVHHAQQVPVAVKVLTGPRARDTAFVSAIANEIHAVARLAHPGVIMVYDKGTITDDAEAESGGRLVAGSPWFAMELCSHGALSPRRFPLPWPTSRTLLLSLLDALAHAHARGAIHRDLKPGNVLLCAPEDPRPGLKISDFGIAHPLGLLDDDATRDAHSGTPRFMAPEQFTGRAREIGPWTDLYATGVLAYQLAMGQAPFSGDAVRLAVAHCHDPVPVLDAHDYPAGYEAWVLRLLEKSPRDRFQKAADAAWGLLQLTPDADVTVSSDWAGALRSLRPRPLYPDDDPSSQRPRSRDLSLASLAGTLDRDVGHTSAEDDTAAHTLGPRVGQEHPSLEFTPAPPPVDGADDSTGPMKKAVVNAPTASRAADDEHTAVARKGSARGPPVDGSPSSSATADTGRPPWLTPDAKHPVIADDDPFAAVLSAGDAVRADRDDDPKTDPRAWAPQAPWAELVHAQHQQPRADDKDHPTIGGPFSLPPTGVDDVDRRRRAGEKDKRARAPAVPPPAKVSWRRPDELLVPEQQRLLGVGLTLYGLRQTPFVGRVGERDRLWQALLEAREGHDRVVVVRGPAGIGRSRLVQWFGERAAEVGAATTLWATHVEGHQSTTDGLAGAMARALRLRTAGDDHAEVMALLREALPALDYDDAVVLVGSLAGIDRTPQDERHAAFLRALRLLSRRRPIVVVVDDAQWGEDALAFAAKVTDSAAMKIHGGCGIVIVLAVADEACAERPAAQQLTEAVSGSPDVVTLSLAPLPSSDHRRLVDGLLDLEASLAGTIARRTAGNPRFAVELVGALVERGALELVPAGFALAQGAPLAMPETLHAAWAARLERLLQTLPAPARICLELGAVLGEEGDVPMWVAVCERAGIERAHDVVAGLIEALARARFVTRDVRHGDVRFAHAMLREAMTRLAHDAGRLSAHHEVIADALAARARSGDDELRARHLVAAGRLDEALPAMYDAIDRALAGESSTHAERLVRECAAALDHAGVADDDPRRLRAMAQRARVLTETGRYDEGAMWARLVEQAAHAPRAARLDALRARALRCTRQGDLERAAATYQELLVLASGDDNIAAGDNVGEVALVVDEALMGLADVHYYQGRLKDAEAVFGRALVRVQDRGDFGAVAMCLWNLVYVALWRGDPATARACVLRAQKLAKALRLQTLAGLLRNAHGDVERTAGLPAEAKKHYGEARALLEKAGSAKVRTVDVNLALCAIAEGDIDGAVARAEALMPAVSRAGEQLTASLCHGVLAVGAAKARDWSLCDAHLAAFMVPQQQGLADGEHALLAEAVAEFALVAGEGWRAGVAESAAKDVWVALGRDDRLEALPSMR